MSIEFDGDIKHPLLLFANPPASTEPKITAKSIVFGPGLHDIGARYMLKPGADVVLQGGAWVRGSFARKDPGCSLNSLSKSLLLILKYVRCGDPLLAENGRVRRRAPRSAAREHCLQAVNSVSNLCCSSLSNLF